MIQTETITAREFITNTFNVDFLLPEELETIITAMELYAKGKCREQIAELVKYVANFSKETVNI